MSEPFKISLERFETNGSAKDADLSEIETTFKCSLPDRYKEFMIAFNGGEGFVGNQYLGLWKASEVIEFNNEYEVGEYAPDLLLFGSNGGGEAFGFDLRNQSMIIRMVPFVGMDIKDAVPIAEDFDEFLTRLSDPDAKLL